MAYNGKWLKQPEHLLFEVAERVARITLNRPDKRNALLPQTLQELHDALLEEELAQATLVPRVERVGLEPLEDLLCLLVLLGGPCGGLGDG